MAELTDMEIRMKACELSVQMCASLSSALVINGGLKNLREMSPFGMVKDIEKYIKTGEYPEPYKVVFDEI